jgi:hypothetical protein
MLIVNKKDRIYLFVDHYFKDKKKISQLILLYRFNINYSEIEIYIVQYVNRETIQKVIKLKHATHFEK